MDTIVNPHLAGEPFAWAGHGAAAQTGLLLLHGFSATTAEVRPLARLLNQSGYTVAGPLLPGHKTTPDDLNACRWPDWADAAEKAYRELRGECDRVIVGGESMGGLLALHLAAGHPEAAAILTYAPAIRMPLARVISTRLLAPFVKYFKPGAGPPTAVDALWQGYAVRPARALMQLYDLMEVVRLELPGLRQPLLVIQGRRDTTLDPRGAESLYSRVGSPVKELHWLEGSTHCVVLDQELPAVADLTLKFVAKTINAETQ